MAIFPIWPRNRDEFDVPLGKIQIASLHKIWEFGVWWLQFVALHTRAREGLVRRKHDTEWCLLLWWSSSAMNTTQVIQSTFIVFFPPCAARPSRCTTTVSLPNWAGAHPSVNSIWPRLFWKPIFAFKSIWPGVHKLELPGFSGSFGAPKKRRVANCTLRTLTFETKYL